MKKLLSKILWSKIEKKKFGKGLLKAYLYCYLEQDGKIYVKSAGLELFKKVIYKI